jgi:RNA polymerase-binding transcription factor DksA
MNCLDCNNEIPAARIEAIGETDYCVNCADKHAAPVVARMIYSHKTAA